MDDIDQGLVMLGHCRSYIGTPFKHQGRSRKAVDCAGLLICGARDMGRDVFDLAAYGREPSKDGLREYIQKNLGLPVPKSTMRPGEIVLMRFDREPHHLGILGDYIHGGLSLVHSYGEVGKVVEHRLDDLWKSRILEVYRL